MQIKSAEQQHDDRLLAMAHRKFLIGYTVALGILPDAELVFTLLRRTLIDVRLADVMQQGGDDDTLALHLACCRCIERLQSVVNHQPRMASIQTMLAESARDIEMMAG